ncbi:MAG: hypothetical protein DHS20C19_06520 [Acidimicrobiales bacterium]|nr:MAG: hypothetical protein DHS20C19_06520 [Acidimicrobiales bacterium]
MPANEPTLTDESEPRPRKCGRCQELFAGDPDEPATAIPAWSACPACREALFGE